MWSAPYIGKTQLAANIWEFRFTRPGQYEYTAGQYAQFHLSEVADDPRGTMRTMSFTSHPTEDFITFVTRVSDQPSPFKQRLMSLTSGEPIWLDAALGDLILPRSTTTPLVFVAGGIGIASFTAMLTEITLSAQSRSVTLLYALRSADQKLFSEQLTAFPFTSYREFMAPDRLSAATILAAAESVQNTLYYLSGTEGFVEGLRHDLLATGLSDSQIAFDYFTGYPEQIYPFHPAMRKYLARMLSASTTPAIGFSGLACCEGFPSKQWGWSLKLRGYGRN